MEFVRWFLLVGQSLLFFPLNGHYCIAARHGFNIKVNQKKNPYYYPSQTTRPYNPAALPLMLQLQLFN